MKLHREKEANHDRQVVSIQVGKPKALLYNEKEFVTAIHKLPVQPPVYLSVEQLAGDEQADLEHHGGPDKAVCVYCQEHYAYWERELERSLPWGAFGENLTVSGMLETEVNIGDIYQIGEALVQVSQPRQPCHKLAKWHAVTDLPLLVQQSGFTGFYVRVLKEGWIGGDLKINLVEPHSLSVSVAYANQIMYADKQNMDGLNQVLAVAALSESWRVSLAKRLS
jgi:MOSC domain-containing protein YiiM